MFVGNDLLFGSINCAEVLDGSIANDLFSLVEITIEVLLETASRSRYLSGRVNLCSHSLTSSRPVPELAMADKIHPVAAHNRIIYTSFHSSFECIVLTNLCTM